MAILETRITQGRLRGIPTQTEGISAFLGIPYAQAPAGERRWRAPEPAQKWDGIRDCSDFGPSCWQADNSKSPFFLTCMERNPVKPRPLRMDEDCLSLNVWTPALTADEHLPVMVWFYGGGLQGGTADDITFDGEGLCQYGVVLVTVNYRTGVFGYFGHPELEKENEHGSSGNYGLLDQIASLQWIHENIAAFGGDPGNVTIFGCSGGGRSVQGIACSPLAEGLVHHAICHSAGGLNPNYSLAYRELRELGRDFTAYCGKKDIAGMRAIPADELQSLYQSFRRQFNITGDGYALPAEMDEMIRQGRQADLDYILSTTAHEFLFPPRQPVTVENFRSMLFGNRTAIFGATVRPETDEQAAHYAEWAEVYEMKSAQLAWAQLQAQQGKKPAYVMSFDHPNPATGRASHGDDQFYVFHTLRKYWFPCGEEEEALSRAMMLRWTNFAKTGNPNGEGLPVWMPFTTDHPLTLSVRSAQDSAMEDRTLPEMEKLAAVYRAWPEDPEKRKQTEKDC